MSVQGPEFVRKCSKRFQNVRKCLYINNRPEQQTLLLHIASRNETQDLLEQVAKSHFRNLDTADLESLKKAQQLCRFYIGEEVTFGSFYSGCSVESHAWSLVADLLKQHSGENINYRLKFIIEQVARFTTYSACMILFGLICV